MRFADPLWFLLLVPFGAYFVLSWRRWEKARAALPFSDLALLEPWVKSGANEERVRIALKAVFVIFAVVAMARPQKISQSKEPPKPVLDIMLCLDTSMSMAALDFDPLNRLEAAKNAAIEFIRKRPVDRIGLVVFGGKALLQCPLTLDHESLIEFLKDVPLNATGAEGTAIGTALALASSRLAESEARSKIIVLLTDGRSNVGNIDPLTAAGAAADLGIKIYTIGCAVPGGGMVPVDDPVFGKRLVRMEEDLDEPTLSALAAQTKGKYFRVTSEKKFKEIYDQIDKMEKTKVDVEVTARAEDWVLPFLSIAFFSLAAGLILKNLVWRTVP